MMGMWDRSTGTLKLPKLGRDLRHIQSMSAGCRGAAMGCNGLQWAFRRGVKLACLGCRRK